MARKGTLTVRLIGDDRKLEQTLKGAGGKVAAFAKGAVIAGGAAAAAFGVKAVTGAVELNETLSKTDQVFKGASDDVVSFADEMAAAFGLPKQEVLDAASNIGLVAKASGLSEDAAADMSTEMAQLAADASSFFNVPLDEALEKIRSGLVGEAEPLRAFGVLLSAAAVEEKAVAMGIAEAGEELTEQQKVMARSAIITEQMTDASGDLERTSDSLANRWRALQGRAENFAAEVGQKLIPVITTVWDWFDKQLPPAMEKLRGFFETRLVPAFAALSGWWQENGPAIIAAAQSLWEGIKAAFDQVVAVVQTVIGWFQTNRDEVTAASSGLLANLQGIWKKITAIFGPAIDAIVAIVSTGVSILTEFWERYGEHIIAFARETWDNILRFIGGILDAIKGVFDTFAGLFTGDWSRMWNGIKAIFGGIWTAIKSVLGQAFDSLKTILGAGVAILSQLWSEAWERVRAVLSYIWDRIVGKVRDKVDAIKSEFNKIVGFIRGLPRRISSVASGMFDGFKSAFRSAINWIIGRWNNLSFSLPSATIAGVTFGGFTLSTPNIPYLEHGGEVMKTGLAVVHKGERFSGTRGQYPIGGGTTVEVTINMPAGSNGDDVVRTIKRWTDRNGPAPFPTAS